MEAINPATGEAIQSYSSVGWSGIDACLSRAEKRYTTWRDVDLQKRESMLESLAKTLESSKNEYAELMTKEMGKPITQAISEVEKCVWLAEHYAEYATSYLSSETYPSPPGTKVKTVYDPLGIILAVMPWNYPFWQVMRFAVPYITAGNVGVLKHSSNVPGCALALQSIFEEAGYPEGVFQSILAPSKHIADVIADDRVKGATLTGSGPAGRAVAATAGENLKKTVLELGGSDPFIVFEDANLEKAAKTGAWARNMNAGQSCIAAKRFLIQESVYSDFLDQFNNEVQSLKVGDPLDEETDIGPLASAELRDELDQQVRESIESGANLILGGEPIEREGAYYEPTVLTDVPRDSPAGCDELFGPVAAVFKFKDESEAIELANYTEFGLGASIWTNDREKGENVAQQIDAGCTYINELTKSDPRIPFGGVKDSGYGRELSEPGIKEFINAKTVWIE